MKHCPCQLNPIVAESPQWVEWWMGGLAAESGTRLKDEKLQYLFKKLKV
jgi:hypothetical protein